MAEREKELTAQSLRLLQQEHESLLAQQSHWDDLRRVTEQMEALTNSRSQVNEDELKDLRHTRDQHRQLESEYSALQKRVRDQEQRVANSERTATAAKQSLIQAQQRASEWERRAREYEGDLEMTRNKLDDMEQAHVQLDADYSLAKLQLEEKEAEDRLVKVLFFNPRLMNPRTGLLTPMNPSRIANTNSVIKCLVWKCSWLVWKQSLAKQRHRRFRA